jgi:hypothetical protein
VEISDQEWEDFMYATGHPVTDWHKLRQAAGVLRKQADDLDQLADEIEKGKP